MTDKQFDTWRAAMESRLNAMQTQLDEADTRIAGLVESNNLLRGDKQRLSALIEGAGLKTRGREFAAPVATASETRRGANTKAQERMVALGLPAIAD